MAVSQQINFDYANYPVAGAFVQAVMYGQGRELAAFGARGDGKTFAALAAMIGHAKLHEANGFPLPTTWIGVRDSFANHKLTTLRSLVKPIWQGGWRLWDQGHLAIFSTGRPLKPLVHVHIFGVEDQNAMDKLRLETQGVWFEEVAPAAGLVSSSGVDETAFNIAITSQGSRAPSHCHPAVITTNLPDEDHWSWQRFKPGEGVMGTTPDHPERMWFRIPPGERATEEDRVAWAIALKDRPDLLARLVEGKPGAIILGPQVAAGFHSGNHVARERIKANENYPLYIGQDFGHTPATVIGQQYGGKLFVLASLCLNRGGVKQQYDNEVIPWLSANAPWAINHDSMIIGTYDPSAADEQTDIEQNPAELLRTKLEGYWSPGPVAWENRKGPMLASMNKAVSGAAALQLCPIGAYLLKLALSSRWYYPQNRLGQVSRDLPKKPNHPWEDVGDAFCYMLCGMGLDAGEEKPKPLKVVASFDPRVEVQGYNLDVKSVFDPRLL